MVSRKLDIQKKQHRERGQLSHRTRLGLLEKRKDYLLRAKDYKSKQARLDVLKRKASEKNKDEFYFGMIKSRTDRGVHISNSGNKALDTDLVKILKCQDAAYVRTQCSIEANRVQKLVHELGSRLDVIGQPASQLDPTRRQILHLLHQDYSAIGANSNIDETVHLDDATDEIQSFESTIPPTHRKTVFVDSVEKVQTYKAKHNKRNKGEKSSEAFIKTQSPSADSTTLSSILETLKSRIKRLRTLQQASSDLSLTQSLMSNGSKRFISTSKKQKSIHHRQSDPVWNGRSETWFDKLDKQEQSEEEERREEEERKQKGIKTGAKVWKWKAERKK